jgi:hypothetical protein
MGVSVTRRTLPLLACTVALLAAAACSSSNAASLPPPRYVEKSAAIAAGDGVCTALVADLKRLSADFKNTHPQATTDEAREFVVSTLTPRLEQGLGDFHRIGEPTKDSPAWNTIVSRLDTDLQYYKAMIPGDPAFLLTTNPFDREAAKFAAYGFKECGQPAT